MTLQTDTPSCADYQALELSPGADLETIKRAYRKLAKQWHPDRHRRRDPQEQARAEARFREINEAYRKLLKAAENNPKARTDASRPRTQPQAPAASSRVEPSRPVRSDRFALDFQRLARWFDRVWRRRLPDRHRWTRLATALGLMAAALTLVFPLSRLPNPKVAPTVESNRQEPNPVQEPSRLQEIPAAEPPAPSPPRDDSPRFAPPAAGRFTLGATPEEVLRAQGPPNRIVGSTWSYGLSEVRFRQGRLRYYNNFDGRLKVQLVPTSPCEANIQFFSLGADVDQVLCVQGTPDRVDGDRWYYGLDMVRFRHNEVIEYRNHSGDLKVRLTPLSLTNNGSRSFRLGSTKAEVLSVQGTPEEVRDDTWVYCFSDIRFGHDRVRWVNDPGGRLKFAGDTQPTDDGGRGGLPEPARVHPVD